MAECLPDEIWLIILNYVPTADLTKSVQYTCKQLSALCYDSYLSKSLDFSGSSAYSFYQYHEMLWTIDTVKNSVGRVCFKGCFWLADGAIDLFPPLPCVTILDLTGCALNAATLHVLFKKVPKLKSLALAIESDDLQELLNIPEDQPSQHPPIFCLEILRIDCPNCFYSYRPNDAWVDLSLNLKKYFLAYSKGLLKIFSLDCLYARSDFVDLYPLPSEYAIQIDFRQKLTCTFPAGPKFCAALRRCNFHKPLLWHDSMGPRYDLNKIKFLSFPQVTPEVCGAGIPGCSGAESPPLLPNLECLILPLKSYNKRRVRFCRGFDRRHPEFPECYESIKDGLVYHCEYPNLKCLDLSCRHGIAEDTMWLSEEFFQRVSLLENLEEINLKGLEFSLRSFLDSIGELEKIHSVSVSLNSIHGYAGQKLNYSMSFCDEQNNFFEDLVKISPNLRKLELAREKSMFEKEISSIDARLLKPLSKLAKLETLSITCNRDLFTKTECFCCDFKNLTSLTLCDFGKNSCRYATILYGGMSSMPKLRDLSLRHPKLELTECLFGEISRFQKLERIVLRTGLSPTEERIQSELLRDVKCVVGKCPDLSIFIMTECGSEYPLDATESTMRDYGNKLFAERTMLLLYQVLDIDKDFSTPFLSKFADFSRSPIADYNAYDFPYATPIVQ